MRNVSRLSAPPFFDAIEKISKYKIDRSTLTGDWFITVSGAMSGSGSAQVPAGGSGSWEGKATVGQALIEMTGTAVLVSTGWSCALRITSSMGVGTAVDTWHRCRASAGTCRLDR